MKQMIMHQLAILDKKRKLLEKILSGKKTIESSWYKLKKTPYGMMKTGDTVIYYLMETTK